MRPFRSIGVPQGIFVSPTDYRAAKVGIGAVDDAFGVEPGLASISHALRHFFADDRAEIALKKAMLIAFESRMRVLGVMADPPAKNGFTDNVVIQASVHPLDAHAARCLGGLEVPKTGGAVKLWTATVLRLVRLMADALATCLTHGGVAPTRAAYPIGAPAQILKADWDAFRQAADTCDLWRDHTIGVLADSSKPTRPLCQGVAWIDTTRLRVGRVMWLRDAVWPCLRLGWAVLGTAVRQPRNPWVLQAAFEASVLAHQALEPLRIIQSYRFDWMIDIEEYTQTHAVRAMVYAKAGARMVHWPHSVMDSPGSTTAFTAYDLYLASGVYEGNTFGSTWWSGTKSNAVGFYRSDHRLWNGDAVRADIRTRVDAHCGNGGKVLAVFLPSDMGGWDRVVADTLRSVLRVTETYGGWLTIIKAKGLASQAAARRAAESDPEIAAGLARDDVLMPEYTERGIEICAAGWLIEKMDVGAGVSSVQIEALVRGKPVAGYYPIVFDTPCADWLFDAGLSFDTPESFETGLASWLDGRTVPDTVRDKFRENFDPFGDDVALERLARLLLASSDRSGASA